MNLADRCRALWERARHAETRTPTRLSVPAEHVESNISGAPLRPDQDYFQVRINELFLSNSREWHRTYDPMVVVSSEFIYGQRVEALPFVVGPAMLEKAGITQVPEGMVFNDTRVAGLHPYRGGRLNLSVILCRVVRQDYARKLLNTVESAAGALDFSAALGVYLKVGKVVMDGVDALLDFEENKPLVGVRREFDLDARDPLQGGYHVLINAPEADIEAENLWVIDGRLHSGATREECEPFRAADYVLYSIVSASARTDLSTLPFYDLWQRVKNESAVASDEGWKSAKANMVSLYQTMLACPDLTSMHANALAGQFVEEMRKIHAKAVELATLEAAHTANDPRENARNASLALLDD
ncbi:hypothetical protein [Sorangium sp. So ce385]|uniref:hypothetical protein n=1 Tax=Sorangium sp. So ce385 TaxID=3133308 RepID=UPI003F5CB5F4